MEGRIQLEYRHVASLRTKEGLEWLESLWLCESPFQEAFQGFCSILTRGKDLCSPTKRHKRKANEKYFASLSGINSESPRTKQKLVSGEHSTKVLRMAKGMSEQTDRWSKIRADEVLSVALLMDVESKGSITWPEFYNFCHRVDDALVSQFGKNSPQKAIGDLYTSLISERQALKTSRFVQSVNHVFDEETLSRVTTQLIKLSIYARLHDMSPLTLLVNLRAHEKRQNHSKLAGVSTAATDASATFCDTSMMSIDALVSLMIHLGADISGEGSGEAQKASLLYQRRLVEQKGHLENLNNISTISALDADADTNASFLLQALPPDSELETSIALLRENASVIGARISAQGRNVEAATSIWKALQSLELELKKVSTPSSSSGSPRTPATPKQSSTDIKLVRSASPVALFASPVVGKSSPTSILTVSNTKSFTSAVSNSPRVLPLGTVISDQTIDSASEAHASVLLSSTRSGSTRSDTKSRPSPIANLSTLRTNLGIFKSPAARHEAINPNFYSEETMSWEGDKSKLSNAYNERFQSTNQVADAKKIFKILGVSE